MKKLENTYKSLPSSFWQSSVPSAATTPSLIKFNEKLANELDLNFDNEKSIVDFFSGISLPDYLTPISMTYAGHQFGHFNPSLGDGRAVLLGEVKLSNGQRYDIQLKGSGKTPYSRGGDGKSSLGPVIREYILSEAMNNLGIPTTRSLCAVLSGDSVFRNEELPGAIFTRVAKSHIRVGTFEYFASKGQNEEIKILCDYLIEREYSHLLKKENKYLNLFKEISKRKLDLVCKWMSVGFIHGVMNTDNTSTVGETIDYGPCAFMDQFEYNKVYSSIDINSRYAYNNQGQIAQWNLSSLAKCFTHLIDADYEKSISILKEELSNLSDYFDKEWIKTMGKKLGIQNATRNELYLINNFLKNLQDNNHDFTNSFRDVPNKIKSNDKELSELVTFLKTQPQSLDESIKLMNSVNPSIIARNHQVEKVITDALKGDYSTFENLISALKSPFEENLVHNKLKLPPTKEEVVQNTFCGT